MTEAYRYEKALYYCLLKHGKESLMKISSKKIIQLDYAIKLCKAHCVDVRMAFSLLILEAAGKLLNRLQSGEPLCSTKTTFNWTEEEDNA